MYAPMKEDLLERQDLNRILIDRIPFTIEQRAEQALRMMIRLDAQVSEGVAARPGPIKPHEGGVRHSLSRTLSRQKVQELPISHRTMSD
jgi:hypothetical protein